MDPKDATERQALFYLADIYLQIEQRLRALPDNPGLNLVSSWISSDLYRVAKRLQTDPVLVLRFVGLRNRGALGPEYAKRRARESLALPAGEDSIPIPPKMRRQRKRLLRELKRDPGDSLSKVLGELDPEFAESNPILGEFQTLYQTPTRRRGRPKKTRPQ